MSNKNNVGEAIALGSVIASQVYAAHYNIEIPILLIIFMGLVSILSVLTWNTINMDVIKSSNKQSDKMRSLEMDKLRREIRKLEVETQLLEMGEL